MPLLSYGEDAIVLNSVICTVSIPTLLPLQEIKPIACARMELRRIMLAVLQFMNAFTAVLKQCFPAYSLCHLSLVTDRQESVLEVCGLLLAISVESSLLY